MRLVLARCVKAVKNNVCGEALPHPAPLVATRKEIVD